MNRTIAITFLVIGVILLTLGVRSWDSVGSDVSQVVTGAPTNKAIALLLAGILLSVSGLVGSIRRTASA